MNLDTIIMSCDKYSFLWKNFTKMFNRYCKLDCNTFLISESKTEELKGINIINTGQLTWTEMLRHAIEKVEKDYIFLLLDDYLLTENISDEEINLHLNFLLEHDSNKIMIDRHSIFYRYESLIPYHDRTCLKFDINSSYLLSTQPSIWKKSFLQSVLDEKLDPWQFETYKTKTIRGKENKLFLMLREKSIYFNAFNKGNPHGDYFEFCLRNNLEPSLPNE
ncbi:MAG: hypothetical protein GWP32_04475 [Bacteroidetes bacterium]|nr:hypothetical protein [Bacteroidota bacterium]